MKVAMRGKNRSLGGYAKTISTQTMVAVVTAVLIGVTGTALLTGSHAATPTAALETESGTVSSTATSIVDSTASGGHAIKFGNGSSGATQANNCEPNPHLCGFPDATNTGVPVGTTLTASGDLTLSTPGQVVSGLNITGCVSITASNVTLKNSVIHTTSGCNEALGVSYSGVSGVKIDHVQIIGGHNVDGTGGSMAGVTGAGYTATYMDVQVAGDGFDFNDNVTVQNSYVHGQWISPGAVPHVDGMQSAGGANVTIDHNTIDNSGGNDSPLLFGADLGDITGAIITNNLLIPTSDQPAYRAGHNSGSSYRAKGIQIMNNRISLVSSGSYVYSFCPDGTNPILFSGNVQDSDGSALANYNSAGNGTTTYYQ